MNVDHIYRPGIAARVAGAASAEWVTAFVDVDRPLGPDDMKVARDPEDRISAIAKTLGTFDAGYVGMTRVPGPATRRYWAAADAVLGREGSAIHVERVLAELAAGSSAERPRCLDVSGIGWLEVDLAEERALAERTIQAAPAEWI
jgi:choline kinase